ncbi:MAG: hypothetical protein U9R60_11720 [Bacteroidota bacterium]|nr:hypothetical protein [Bacteroidota bacterium]
MYSLQKSVSAIKVLSLALLILFAFACKKDDNNDEDPPPPPPPVPSDTVYFNDFSGGLTLGWIPIYGNWVVENEVYKVTHDTNLYAMTCALDTVLTDYIFEVRLRKISGEIFNVGIIFNGDPNLITPLGNWRDSYKLVIGTNKWWNLSKLYENLHNNIAEGTSEALNPGMGTWNVVRVVVSGGKIEVVFNGVSQGTFNDNTHTSGHAGISMFDQFYLGEGEFDYIMISRIPDDYEFPAKKHTIIQGLAEGNEGDFPKF